MGLQILPIDEQAQLDVNKVVEFAKQREHWYDPYKVGAIIPGSDPRYVCNLGTYRCVFTYTIVRRSKKILRHLSISVKDKGRLPAIPPTMAIAQMFGFTADHRGPQGPIPEDWIVHVQADHPVDDDCIVLAQLVDDVVL